MLKVVHSKLYYVIEEIGAVLVFFKMLVNTLLHKKVKSHDVFEQIWTVTVESAPITSMAGFFVGSILTVQFTLQLSEFGALSYLGGLSTSATIREIGPLLIAFLLSGKIGAYTSAELGTMRVTEQIDAIRCLGADPIQEIILPRFIGIIVSSAFLLGSGLIMSVFGGILLGSVFSGVNYEEYIRHVPTMVVFSSVISGVVKCFSFSFVLALLCTYYGYNTRGGAKGVGQSVIKTSVYTMVTIVVMDWFTSFVGESLLVMWRGY